MNHKRIIIVNLLLLLIMRLSGQTVAFIYDDNGNMVSRILVVEQLRSKTVSFPVNDPKTLKSFEYSKGSSITDEASVSDQSEEEKLSAEDDKIIVVVYPNPNKGLLNIDISNRLTNSKNELRIYDFTGMEILSRKDFENHLEIDISRCKDGIYIMRIKINDKVFDWKIIKKN